MQSPGVEARRFQRDEEQSAEAVSHGLRVREPARATGSPGSPARAASAGS